MTTASRSGASVLEAQFRFLLWLIPTLNRFPRDQKFLLGDRIQVLAQDILEQLIEANYSRERRSYLAHANIGLEKLRYLVRLSVELHYLDGKRYEHAARAIDDIGRQVGGWMKAQNATST